MCKESQWSNGNIDVRHLRIQRVENLFGHIAPFPYNNESLRHMCFLNQPRSLVKDARFAQVNQPIGLPQFFPFVKVFLVKVLEQVISWEQERFG